MGFLDISAFVIGRQTVPNNIWLEFNHQQNANLPEIEPVSGLPSSLLSLFSRLGEKDLAVSFLSWRCCNSDIPHYHLWESYRYAGALAASKMHENTDKQDAIPSDGILIMQVLASVDAVRSCKSHPTSRLVQESLIYPLVIAGRFAKDTSEKELICRFFKVLIVEHPTRRLEMAWKLIEYYWESGGTKDFDDIAAEWETEISIL